MQKEFDVEAVTAFAEKVAYLCLAFPFSVTSWIRTPKRNAVVGGVWNSHHMQGLAVDIVPDDPNAWDELMAYGRKLGFAFQPEGDHIHVQLRKVAEEGEGVKV